jgi:hypothetical protein
VSLGQQFEESPKRFCADGNQAEPVMAARGFTFF